MANLGKIINTMAISQGGRYIAAGTSNSTVIVINAVDGTQISNFQAHSGEIWHIEFSPEDRLLTSGGDKTIKGWNLNGSNMNVLVKGETNIHAFTQLPSGQLIIGLENGQVREMDQIGNNSTELFSQSNDPVTVIRPNQQNTQLAIGFESGSIQLWDLIKNEIIQTLPGHTAHVADIQFSSDDQFLISGGYDRKNLLWNLRRIKEQPIVWNDHESFVLAVSFTPGVRKIITGELNGTMKIYERNMAIYANRMCSYVKRNLTEQEWASFIGENFSYEKTCKSLPQ
jgi:WD40 repeat protein